MVRYRVHACTDITGFDVMGHLLEMAQGAGVAIDVDAAAFEFLPRAREFAAMGIVPAGAYRNREYAQASADLSGVPLDVADLLFDPQTSGGLMICVDAEDAPAMLAELAADPRVPVAVEVGRVLPYDDAGDDDDAPDGAGPARAFAYTGSPAALFASGPGVIEGTYSDGVLQVVSALVAALEQGVRSSWRWCGYARSSPRSAGAWMAVDATGSIAGTVGGGAMEDIAIREAMELLAAGSSRTVSYTMGGRVSDTGMVCGGMIDLCYLHLDSDKLEFFKQLEKVLVERGDGALEIDLAPFATARPADAPAHGAESAATIVGAPALSVVDVEPGVAAGVTDADGAPVYLEPLCPEGLTYIFGSGHVGRAPGARARRRRVRRGLLRQPRGDAFRRAVARRARPSPGRLRRFGGELQDRSARHRHLVHCGPW